MAPVIYSAQELLRMRAVPARKETYDEICQKLQKDLSIEDILRFPVNRPLPLIPEEDTEKLASVPNGNPTPVQQLDGTDSEWRYRGRTENECGEPQPISAPPGLVAQKDEGFQRFYKAVVSPTHVRVTAGGRIVPNTRASSSPTCKWAKDKPPSGSLFPPRPLERETAENAVANGAQYPFGPFPSLYPGYAPAMHGSAYAMFPWQIYNTFCLPAPMPQTAFSKPSGKDSSRHQQDGVDDRQEGTEPSPHQAAAAPMDVSRPFYFNGQWAMPHNPSLFAYGMPAFSGFPQPSMAGSVTAPPAVQPTPATSNSAPAPSYSVAPAPVKPDKPLTETVKPIPAAAASPATQTTASLTNPPISSIRPSEITKKQIDVLKGSLKYLEDQLLYNKHQIDEKWMEYQAHMVRQQVDQFEKNLQNQKSFEEAYYPKSKENSSTSSASLAAATPSADETPAPLPQDGTINSGQKPWREKDREYFQTHQGINSTKSVSLFPPKRLGSTTEPTKKASTLPVHAALAPPFQPQNEGSVRSSFFQSRPLDTPYLIGMIPTGSNQEKARETGYQYVRDLSNDELRARHMYWGKAPHHLQRGLPKFDGKDFYPPSPTRDRTSESNDSLLDVQSEGDGPRSANNVSVYDPFRSLGRPRQRVPRGALGQTTQSEALARNSSCGSSVIERGTSCTGKIGRQYEDARKNMDPVASTGATSSKFNSDSEEGDDGRSILFKGRKPTASGTKSRNEIWQSMLNKGKSSGQAAPSTISAATAHGVLPQYRGHATAYLTPTIANTSTPARAIVANGKAVDGGDLIQLKSTETVQTENMPPIVANDNESIRQDSLRKFSNAQGILSQ
ncbi:hypothetical protein ISF_08478 [Cordyceps fumosorosea ARSEF 2679]|uniref:Uncharacterized protein n=1 Tax=Cordyceps fumosorosea (strain ARSEF 2679) TaxID=1081104 RepID=A0A162K6H9_CORFA|nr:hypothetical protein ISF_08478 [Cordyceps fumosorosea ARSEF 2679]OAA53998.1 hypothetical protein ISF_08478 [Cordyceps fumosorosea ARSEF 2679]